MKTSIDQLNDFLDHLEKRNLIPGNTVSGRRTGLKHVLATLADDEEKTVEYLTENVDSILTRFTNKAKLSFKANSLEDYKSRFRSTLDDFNKWSSDPAAWERSIGSKPKAADKEPGKPRKVENNAKPELHIGASTARNSRTVSIPLRGGKIEAACVIPADNLTVDEFQKIGRILAEYLKDGEPRPTISFKQLSPPSEPVQNADA